MSELQAQWLAMIIKGRAKLPSRAFMNETRIKEKVELRFAKNMFLFFIHSLIKGFQMKGFQFPNL